MTIRADVRTRFDSTLLMFESILKNRPALFSMQERGRRDDLFWPSALHLPPDYFRLIEHVTTLLRPVIEVTKALSLESAWNGDVLPALPGAVDEIGRMNVTSDAKRLKELLISTMSNRIKMLLSTDQELPLTGGASFSSVTPTEYVTAAIAIICDCCKRMLDAFRSFPKHLPATGCRENHS